MGSGGNVEGDRLMVGWPLELNEWELMDGLMEEEEEDSTFCGGRMNESN